MTKLFITADQVKQTTSISGDTDNGLIRQKIYYAQVSEILRVLGQELYDKILNDLTNDIPLTGEYLIIFNKYIIDMHIFWTAYYFTLFNDVKQSNVGNVNITGQGFTRSENTHVVAEQYKGLAASVEGNFRAYADKINLAEWISSNNSGNESTNVTGLF